MKEISEIPRKQLEKMVKDLQADCRHLNSMVAVYELTISPLKNIINDLRNENKELKEKLKDYENN